MPSPEVEGERRRRLRADSGTPSLILEPGSRLAAVLWVVLAGGFVLLWGGNLELGPAASRLGMATAEGFGPLGRVVGGWDPDLWPGRVVPSQVWAWFEGARTSIASVRWPEAVAALGIGLILSRRLAHAAGRRAGVLVALTLFGSLGLIHRAEGAGMDPIAGLAVVAALDRILGRGPDLLAGIWLALGLLAGGWPPVLMVLLPMIVLRRPGVALTTRLLAPPALVAVAWSAWAIRVASAEAWGAAIALPLTKGTAWWVVPGTLALGLPWTPLAGLVALPGVRKGWDDATRSCVLGWLTCAGVAALAGTFLPGLGPTARVVGLAGLAVAAAVVVDGVALRGGADGDRNARRALLGLALGLGCLWAAAIVPMGGYLAAAVPYYRPVALFSCALAVMVPLLALQAALAGRPGLAVASIVLLAAGLKLAHGAVYVPEWNYRLGQGPWGRAVGQWVPPNWPLYVVHAWPDDLLFATDRPVRQVAAPQVLEFKPKDRPHYVLLLEPEFTHWPGTAPRLEEVRRFRDERGGVRVLARTGVGQGPPRR